MNMDNQIKLSPFNIFLYFSSSFLIRDKYNFEKKKIYIYIPVKYFSYTILYLFPKRTY